MSQQFADSRVLFRQGSTAGTVRRQISSSYPLVAVVGTLLSVVDTHGVYLTRTKITGSHESRIVTDTATIYHNPRCSKSRQTLELLTDRGMDVNVVEYLKSPPTAGQLRQIVKKLGIAAPDLIRRKESIFKEVCPHGKPDDDEAIQLMAEHPKLIERPIVLVGNKAAIGRPPENVVEIL